MASFEDDFYLENPTRWQAFKRDCRLLGRLGIYALMWLTRGVLVRRAYRQAQQTGKPLDINTTIPD
ncbi:MAG: hypothetical protein AAGI44_17495 [Pseudomonadota bacterium]